MLVLLLVKWNPLWNSTQLNSDLVRFNSRTFNHSK